MNIPVDHSSHGLEPEHLDTLHQLFSGKMFAGLSISHQDAMETIGQLDKVLNPDMPPPDTSLASFIHKLGKAIGELDSPLALQYSERLEEAAQNALVPTRKALQTVRQTLEAAHSHADLRDPEQRKQLAASLKKLPAAIDFIVGQLDSFSEDFQRIQRAFREELDYTRTMKPGSISDDHEEDHELLLNQMDNIQTIFNNSRMPVHQFRARHIQIKNLASNLEKKFLLPPSAPSERVL